MNSINLVGGANSLRVNATLAAQQINFRIVANVKTRKLNGKDFDLDILPIQLVAPAQTVDYKSGVATGSTTTSANIVIVDDLVLSTLNGFDHNQNISATVMLEAAKDKEGKTIFRNTFGNFMGQPKTN
jgi:hypothetical protein